MPAPLWSERLEADLVVLRENGFAILDRLRAHCPQAESVLMDEETLLACRDRWVPDPNHAARTATPLARLTATEQVTDQRLRDLGGVRLEQERLAWPVCLAALGVPSEVGCLPRTAPARP